MNFADMMRDLGAFMVLLEHAPVQQRYPLRVLYTRLWPPLQARQYLVQWQHEQPRAFVCWAWLSAEVSQRYHATRCTLADTDWVGGDQLWFMEIIADDAHLLGLMRDLRQRLPPGAHAQWHRVSVTGRLEHHSMRLPPSSQPEMLNRSR
jgi:hemolysin-activating ACP:hemolysin acyltransferase